jgi:3-phosphoshikimate 1-carboxyvinyltransferase
MELKVEKTERIEGVVNAPPSKSYTHRALIIASLAEGESKLLYPLYSADTLASLEACQAFGCTLERKDDICLVEGSAGKLKTPQDVLDLKNSGTTLRLATTMASLAPGCSVLTGDDSLRGRPMQDLLEALRNLGVRAYATRKNGLPPIVVKNGFKGGKTNIKGNMSSQYISSILLSAPYAQDPVELRVVGEFISRPYVDMTLDIMERFGVKVEQEGSNHFLVDRQTYHSRSYTIEGDFSSASYVIAAVAAMGGKVTVGNLFCDSKQGDKKILEIVERMGTHVQVKENQVTVQGDGELKGTEVNLENSPDLLPTVASLASLALGTTRIFGVEHARYKETDRVHTVALELARLGVKLTEKKDGLIINGGTHGGVVESHGDHRLAMALSLIGLKTGNLVIRDAEAYQVSFPRFLEVMNGIGCRMEIQSDL